MPRTTYRNAASLPRAEVVSIARERLLGIAADLETVLAPRDLIGLITGVQVRVMGKFMDAAQQAGYLRDIAAHLDTRRMNEDDLRQRLSRTG